jgi:TolB protein
MTHFPPRRRATIASAFLFAAALAAGCSSPPEPVATQNHSTPEPASHNAEATVKDVPWSKVGPGWTLATWSPAILHRPGKKLADEANAETATTLYLVDPAGNRYAITTFSGKDAGVRIADWSGDGSHALFADSDAAPSKAISVDLHTGEQTTIPVDGHPKYTRPEGTTLLVSADFNGNEPGTLKRVDFAGNVQRIYPTENLGGAGQFSGQYLASPDGTQLVLATANLGTELVPRHDDSLVVMDNNGIILRTLPTPTPNAECSPVRWWAPNVVLAHCTAERSSASQLWAVPINGEAPTALTAINSGQGGDPGFGGDLDDRIAWKLPSGTFLQSAGACGSAFLSRLTPDGHTTRVAVPDVSENVRVTGVTGDKLVLRAEAGCGGDVVVIGGDLRSRATSLLTYDPVANTSTVLLGPPVNGGGVTDAILYQEN